MSTEDKEHSDDEEEYNKLQQFRDDLIYGVIISLYIIWPIIV
jgi:hypothetical protein